MATELKLQADMRNSEHTLAAHFYTDPSVMRAEIDDLFHSTWQFVCHISDLAKPGDYFTFEMHGQDYFLVLGQDHELRGFANVCPHRGHKLVEGHGNKSRITCPYHAWTFGLDGALRGARGISRRAVDFEKLGLSPIAVDTLAGFVFVNTSGDADPLRDFAPGLEGQIFNACPDILDYVPDRDGTEFGHTYICDANWKVMIDNYLECYHCQMAHPDFNEMMAIPDSLFTLFPNFTYQNAPTKKKSENLAFPLDLTHDVLVGEFWWLFPNITLGRFPGTQNFYVSRFDPLTPGRTSRYTLSLKPAEDTDEGAAERERLRSVWTRDVVAKEDQSLCENVQRGMSQRSFRHGWYITDLDDHGISEHAMRHFHKRYDEWVNAMQLRSIDV
jgi:choline monooxygenase